jgi:hypothetical protein
MELESAAGAREEIDKERIRSMGTLKRLAFVGLVLVVLGYALAGCASSSTSTSN